MSFRSHITYGLDALNGFISPELECLRHLRELRADGNRIESLDGLQKMDGLIKLSLQGNIVREVDLHEFKWCVGNQCSSLTASVPVRCNMRPLVVLLCTSCAPSPPLITSGHDRQTYTAV